MIVRYHPEFPKDILHFETEYRTISDALAARFRSEVEEAIQLIEDSPERAGHFLHVGSQVVRQFRRRNLRNFPFFVLYGTTRDSIILGSVVPSRSDPLTWLTRFGS